MTMDFSPSYLAALEFTERHEGGYSNTPGDQGGETKFGISKRIYPKIDIKNLSRNQAREIYKRDYWDKVQAESLPSDVAKVVFDTSVHSGVPMAAKHLQTAIGANPDGIVGPRTLKKLDKYLVDKSSYDLAKSLIEKRRWLLTRIAVKKDSQRQFYSPWMKRVDELERELDFEESSRREAIIENIAEDSLG